MKSAEISIRNPVGTILIVLAVVVLGFFSIPRIPVSFWPEFIAPALIVMVPYPGADPEVIEDQIAEPLEENLSTIDGIDEIETTCMEGVCQMTVRFEWGIDFDQAKLDVQERTNKARSSFPRDIQEPTVLQVQDFLPPGIEIGFFSNKRDLSEIRDFIETRMKNRFLRLSNVATVQISGGEEKYVTVSLNPEKMKALGLTFSQISSIIASENNDISAGKLETRWRNNFIKIMGKFENLSDIENVIIAAPNGVPIYLKNVAQVAFRNLERESITRLDGKEIVSVSIREKSGGNTVAMVNEVRQELEDIRESVPEDIQIRIIRDQSVFIKQSIRNVLRNAAIGAVLASLIILLFLGNLRNTLIIVLSIPISIIGTFILINFAGLSINTISLGGLALGVGMIVDSSIVVIENIYRHLKENQDGDRQKTVVSATREVGLAVTSSNLTSIVVFLPLAFLIGLFAVLLGELALTVVFALSLSVIVALTVVPMLSYKLMRINGRKGMMRSLAAAWQNLFERVVSIYRYLISGALHHGFMTLLAAFLLLILFIRFITPLLDVEMLPAINQGEFRIELSLAEGTRLEVTDNTVKNLEQGLSRYEEIDQIYTLVGVFSARGELKSNFSTVTVNLKEDRMESLEEVMSRIRREFRNLPGTELVVRQTDVTEGMRREPVDIRIFGPEPEVLNDIGEKALTQIKKIPGVVNLSSSLQEGLSEIGIYIDREKAGNFGLNTAQIASTVRTAVRGATVTRLSSYDTEYDITVEVVETEMQNINDVLDLPVTTARGFSVPLRSVASFTLERSPSEIKRLDQQRMLEIKGDVSGRPQRQVLEEVRQAINQLDLPTDYYISFGGQSRSIADSFRSLLTALIIAIFLVYVVMGAQFNSFIHPFTIAFTIPLAVIGVLLGLFIFGSSLSMNALLGMIMLVGIVVNNGILLIDYINQLRSRGMSKDDAIIEAGATRLRPILITTLTTIFGMLPIALGLGKGGEALQPLGAVVVGGLATSTLLTLIVIPCVYSLLDRVRMKDEG
ncbi:MAG: efflux RND transporter permease subunit [Calditrichaeota bacterium]|nr:efflux RND transporter permease subunit [Calditrichota bacterium]RQW03326.1 MAG: efflux RND transporter permease subunit [Calditrichota bacterium]